MSNSNGLQEAMAYLIKKYPSQLKGELSNARLTKMMYLADWHHVLTTGDQISQIHWYFDNYGPYVLDVYNEAREHPDVFAVTIGENIHGGEKKVIGLRMENYEPKGLSESARRSLDHIVSVCSKLYWDDFIQLVYSTHPILITEKYNFLDLKKAAEDRRKRYGK